MQIVSNTGTSISIVQDGSNNINFLASSLNLNGNRLLTSADIGSIIPHLNGVLTVGMNSEFLGGMSLSALMTELLTYTKKGGYAGTAQQLETMINALPSSQPVAVATQTTNGLMSSTDKVKLDTISAPYPLANTGIVSANYRGIYNPSTVYNNGDTVLYPDTSVICGVSFPTSNVALTTRDVNGTNDVLKIFKDGIFYNYTVRL